MLIFRLLLGIGRRNGLRPRWWDQNRLKPAGRCRELHEAGRAPRCERARITESSHALSPARSFPSQSHRPEQLDKPDTGHGWASVGNFAEHGSVRDIPAPEALRRAFRQLLDAPAARRQPARGCCGVLFDEARALRAHASANQSRSRGSSASRFGRLRTCHPLGVGRIGTRFARS